MGLSGEHELHGALGVGHHRSQALDIGQDQAGSLVSGEAPGEAIVRASGERIAQVLESCLGFAAVFGLFYQTTPHKLEEARLEVEVRLPKFAVVHVFNAFQIEASLLCSCQPLPRWRSYRRNI